jgi:predicted PurR-regulated permease PerM
MSAQALTSRSGLFLPLLALTGFIFLLFFLLWFFSSVTIPFAGALIIAYLFSPIVDWLERCHVPRALGALLIMVILFGVVVTLAFWVVPLIIHELHQFVVSIPMLSGTLSEAREELSELFPLVSWDGLLQDAVGGLEDLVKGFLASLPGILSGLLMVIYNAVIIPFLLFFFLKDGRIMIRRLVDLAPNRYFEMSVNFVNKLDCGVGRFLRGLLIQNSIVATISVTGLTLIGMPSALVVGLLIGIVNVIPYMGPTIGFIVAAILTLIDPVSNPPLLAVMATVAVVQLCDNMFIYPLVIGKCVHMHPVLVIGALLLGGFFFGFVGMIIAVPVATSLTLVYTTFIHARREYAHRG